MKANLQIKPLHYLDTLEVTSDYFKDKTHATQYYKAIRKHKTNVKLKSIIDSQDAPDIKKRYWTTYHCNNVLLQDGNKFTGSLCRKRWCTECCRIKTAELTNGYKQPMQDLGQLYFVTLTRPNVKARQLKSEIKKMLSGFQKIKDNLRKTYKIKLQGIRKIEITYNHKTDSYHPHFHFIQDNLHATELMQDLWLQQFSNASIKGQDIRSIDMQDENSFIELFKYATKETTKDGATYSGEVLHTIYNSIQGLRIYQTYGSIRKVKKPIEAEQEQTELSYLDNQMEIWYFEQDYKDWITATGELLIDTISIQHQIKNKKLINLPL